MLGTLYLIKSGNYIKIGYTSNWEQRKKNYITHNPEFKILNFREGTKSDEYYLHKLFQKYLINDSEWMIYKEEIINVFNIIKLNHKIPARKSKNKRRLKHIEKIKKRRKLLKECNTVFINKYGQRKTII